MIGLIKKWYVWAKSLFPDPNRALKEALASLESLEQLDFSNLQNIRKVVVGWDIGEERNLNGTLSQLLYKGPDKVVFCTQMPPGMSFLVQWHILPEICEVKEGVLGDKLDPERKVAKKGEIMYFPPEHPHLPYNPSDTEFNKLIVTFWSELPKKYRHEKIDRSKKEENKKRT